LPYKKITAGFYKDSTWLYPWLVLLCITFR